jgi:hypothetical protein
MAQGQGNEALKEITYIKKKTKLDDEQKIQIAVWQHWLGQSEAALKLLGKPLSYSELETTEDLSLLKKNIRIAHMLSYAGALSMADIIFHDIKKIIDKKKINLNRFYPQFFNTLGNHYLRQNNHQKALESFQNFKMKDSLNMSTLFFNQLGIADSYSGLKQYSQSLKTLRDIEHLAQDKSSYKAIYYQAKAEYYLALDQREKALQNLTEAEAHFSAQEKETKDYAYQLITLGEASEKDNMKRKYLSQAYSILEKSTMNMTSKLRVLQLLKKAGKKIDHKQQISLLKEELSFKNKKVIITCDSITLYDKSNDHVFDETISLPCKKALLNNQEISLNEREVCILKNILLSGHLGIHEMALSDCIYQDRYNGYEHLMNRLKRAVSRLKKKLSLPIQWKQNRLYLEEITTPIIVSL